MSIESREAEEARVRAHRRDQPPQQAAVLCRSCHPDLESKTLLHALENQVPPWLLILSTRLGSIAVGTIQRTRYVAGSGADESLHRKIGHLPRSGPVNDMTLRF